MNPPISFLTHKRNKNEGTGILEKGRQQTAYKLTSFGKGD